MHHFSLRRPLGTPPQDDDLDPRIGHQREWVDVMERQWAVQYQRKLRTSEAFEDDVSDDSDGSVKSESGLRHVLRRQFLMEEGRNLRVARRQETLENTKTQRRIENIQGMKESIKQKLELLEQDRLRAERKAASKQGKGAEGLRPGPAIEDADARSEESADAPFVTRAGTAVGGIASARGGGGGRQSARRRSPGQRVVLPKLGVHRASDLDGQARAATAASSFLQEVPASPGSPSGGMLARRPIMWSMGKTREWLSAVAGTPSETEGPASARGGAPVAGRARRALPLDSFESVVPARNNDARGRPQRSRPADVGQAASKVRRLRDFCK